MESVCACLEPWSGIPDQAVADFEDALQVADARACGARLIVTRNVRDYVRLQSAGWIHGRRSYDGQETGKILLIFQRVMHIPRNLPRCYQQSTVVAHCHGLTFRAVRH